MKKLRKTAKKILMGAAAASGAITFSSCSNVPECVYGPPEYFETPAVTEETESPAETSAETETAADIFAPEINIPDDVYGPPSFFNIEDGTYE